MAVYSFEGKVPEIGKSAYVHESAQIVGDVVIGEECFIGAGAIIRGDYGAIRIGPRTAVEEGCIIHAPPRTTCKIGKDVTIGHGAIIHCAKIEDFAVIGMGAIISISTVVGKWAIVGEGGVVTTDRKIPPRKVVAGYPAGIVGDTTEEQQKFWSRRKEIYVELCHRYQKGLEKL